MIDLRHAAGSLYREAQINLAYRLGWTRLPYPPRLVSLEPTNYCNLRCPMCPVSQQHLSPEVGRGLMDLELFASLIPELRAIDPIVVLHMGGESLMHRDLPSMIGHIRAERVFVRLDSNAMLLTERLARELIDADLNEIYFDLDSDSPASFEAIRVGARFQTVVSNIQRFLRLRFEPGAARPRVILKNIRHYDGSQRREFPVSYRAHFASYPPDEYRCAWADHCPGSHRTLIEEHQRYAAPPIQIGRYDRCTMLWTNLAIGWDELVTICCLDLNRTTDVGNVRDIGILGAWNAPAMQRIRRACRGTAGRAPALRIVQSDPARRVGYRRSAVDYRGARRWTRRRVSPSLNSEGLPVNTSPVALRADQIRKWRTEGFLVLPQALSPERSATVRAAVDRLYEQYLAGQLENLSRDRETATIFPPHWRWIDPGWDRRALAFRRWNIVEDDPIFIDLIDDDAFFSAVLQIMGPLVQVGMTHAIVLPPEMADPPYLHVDGGASLGRIRPDAQSPPLSVRVQLFLTDLDAEDMGNFMVVPGSHTQPLPDDPLHNPPSGTPPLQQLRVRAGDAVLFMHSLWHGAAANHGRRDRKTLLYGYVQRFLKPYDYERISPGTLSRCTPRQRLLLGDLGGWHWRAGCHYYENDDFADIMARGA